MLQHLTLTCLLGLAAAGCALNQPGTTPTAFDGTYSGTVTYIHAAPNGCPSTAPVPAKLAVQNGSVVWSNAGAQIYAPVAQDGSFYTANGATSAGNVGYFSGKISNRSMVARVNTGACHQVYDLTRQG